MPDTVKVVEIDHVKEKLIERFAERLKEAYPQSDRNNPDPMICYGDFCDIVDEVAAEITDSIANGEDCNEDRVKACILRWLQRPVEGTA